MKRVALLLLLTAAPVAAQRPTYQQQMQDNQRRLEGIKRERSEVEQELSRLRTQAHSLSDEIANIESQKQSTNRIVNELDRQITGLGAQIDQITLDLLIAQDALLEKRAVLERRLVRLDKDGRTLNDRIEALERARREAESRGVATGAGTITTADLGGLDWPVEGGGSIIYPFGTTTGPNNTRIPRHGIGIKAPVGTAVRAVAAGTVSLAGPLGLYLTSVLIDHGGGYYTFYAYLNDATVRPGDRVIRGQVIGHVGGESSDEGPHLHFEIRGQGGIALDPGNWLRSPRPRR